MVSKRLMKRLAEKFTNRCLIPIIAKKVYLYLNKLYEGQKIQKTGDF